MELSTLQHRLSQLGTIAKGYLYKFQIDIFGLPKLKPLDRHSDSEELIVSLTSYGRRVNKVVYYTLVSLLQQSKLPNRIILWIDKEHWNDNNLPVSLKKLIAYGIEIKYCEDIRSYTKLIPSLENYPNATIITVDDDVIYRDDLINDLYEAHINYPKDIICNMARYPIINNNEIAPYESWFEETDNPVYIMPLGVSGVLYPPNSLYKDTLKKDLFKRLSPLADDLWFWSMGILNNTKYRVINQKKLPGCNFDGLYQFLHRDSSLTQQNREQKMNDIQIKAIIDYYNIDLSDPLNITYNDPNNK